MANEIIRPSELPLRSDPVASEVVPSDNGSTVAGVTWEDGVNAAVPPASQLESEAGVINSKRMTPLTTKQAIDAQVDPKISTAIGSLNLGSASQANVGDFATAAQGALADTAVQPGALATVATTGDYDDLTNKPTLGTAAAADTGDFAAAAQAVPAGGTTGQVLAKASNTDNDVEWRPASSGSGAANFDTVTALLADNNSVIGYTGSGAASIVGEGEIVTAQGFRYEVAASGAVDWHVETSGGVKLYVLPNDGYIYPDMFDDVINQDVDAGNAINKAIEVSVATQSAVKLLSGTYLLKGVRHGLFTKTLLKLQSNLTIEGSGYESCIKLDDDLSDIANTSSNNGSPTKDYRVFCTVADSNAEYRDQRVDNFTLKNLRIDGNGSNNTVASSTGGSIRRGYHVCSPGGDNVLIEGCWFENCAGRNVFVFNSATEPTHTNLRILKNVIRNVGASVPGNIMQNDHSSIYTMADQALVAGNILQNDTAIEYAAALGGAAVVGLEIHGRNTIVAQNIISKYGRVGNAVSQIHESRNNLWIGNQAFGISGSAIQLWSRNFRNKNLRLIDNHIEIDNVNFAGGNGISQFLISDPSDDLLEDFQAIGNTISYLNTGSVASTSPGILLSSVEGFKIERNTVFNAQGAGIEIVSLISKSIRRGKVTDNNFINVGLGSGGLRLWGVYVDNRDANVVIEDIEIDDNMCVRPLRAVGTAPSGMRGIRVTGSGGPLRNIVVGGRNRYKNILRAQRVEFNSMTDAIGVQRIPREVSASGAAPVCGYFENGAEVVRNTTWAPSGYIGAIPVTPGAASSENWASATAYKAGQWIKLADGRVIEYTVSGTSGASEPNPTVLMQQYTDGTARFVYRDSVSAVFKAFGAIEA